MTLSRQHRADLKRKRSKLSPAAKSEHRAGVFEAARVEGNGIVRCYAADLPGGYVCSGRLEAAHFIAVQTLRIKQSEARIYIETQHDPRMALAPGILELVNADLSDLIADPRNGVPLCSEHHATFDGKRPPRRLSLTPPPSVVSFATEYGLTHLLEPASTLRTAPHTPAPSDPPRRSRSRSTEPASAVAGEASDG